ncbi:hypothetical protein SAMN02910447_01566 [Ruminococcus sp. YE71]|uniref:fibronectin type III domain-containing protein n=1 Tax=unclassified Ruminococcus TaxID=2608920 RepID=UPI0008851F6E|nr:MULTISPECIES: fibronectin type III domain-containing protein [unclassified Ruminococcus]SDA18287.1 hypothetical protein SAMN02910446_01406 [Ruminococcus sp. YE78]SFW30169.1 hypothetical protein SAMN02910447_01566 [Ruminococcus sp. YE71]
MTHNFTKRTLASVLAVLCAAGSTPASLLTNGFIGSAALTVSAEGVDPLTHFDAVEPTCTKDGNIEYWWDLLTLKFYTDADCENEITIYDTIIPATGHSYGEPEWTWSEDNSAASAVFTCSACGETETAEAAVTSEKKVYPTHENEGLIVYTATAEFDGKTYTDTKEEVLPTNTLEHFDAIEPTCTKDGQPEFWWDLQTLKFYLDPDCTQEVTIFDVTYPKYGHDFGDTAEWNWSDDFSSATFTGTCARCGETVTEKASVTAETTEPTCTSEGQTVYTAACTIAGKTYTDTRTVVLEKLTNTLPVITTKKGSGSVKLSWTAVKGAEKYAVVAYVNGSWKKLAEGNTDTYTVTGLTAGKTYKVAVIAKVDGKWITDVSNAVEVTAGEVSPYPEVSTEINDKEVRISWEPVSGAEAYAIAYYRSGKWRVLKQLPPSVTYYVFKNIPTGTYKIAVAAKLNGKWDTTGITNKAITIIIK